MSSFKNHGSSQSGKLSQMKDEAGNAALIPGSSAWGAMKGGTSQKLLPLSTDTSASSSEKVSPKPSPGEKSWMPASSTVHINGVVSRWPVASASTATDVASDSTHAASGWGSPDSSPIPNAGTEVWSAQKQSGDSAAASRWGSANSSSPLWGGTDSKNTAEVDSKLVWGQVSSPPAIWGDTKSLPVVSPTASQWGARETVNWSSVGSGTQPVTSSLAQPSTLSTWAQAAGRGLTVAAGSKSSNSAPGANMSREELIVRAINSQDGWGQMPIRQDTAWDVSNDTPLSNVAYKMTPATEPASIPVQQVNNNTGTAIWEASKDGPAAADLVPRSILTSSNRDNTVIGNLPWVVSEANIATGWGIPMEMEGSALLSGERSLPSVKSGTNSAWNALLDAKDASVSGLNTWNMGSCADAGGEAAVPSNSTTVDTAAPDVGTSQQNTLVALLDKYDRQSSNTIWESSLPPTERPSDPTTLVQSPSWGGQALPPLHLSPGGLLSAADQSNDVWSQSISKSTQWAGESHDNAIWSSAALGKSVGQGSAWGDQGWSGISTDLKAASSSALWSAHADLSKVGMPVKKTGDTVASEHLQGEAISPMAAATGAIYSIDNSLDVQQKYRQLCIAAGSVPSSAVSRVPSSATAAGSHGALVAAASTVKPATGIVAPNIYKPPPALPAFPPPIPQSKPTPPFSPQQAQQLIQAQLMQQLQTTAQGGQIPLTVASAPPTPSLIIQLHQLVQLQQVLQRLQLQQASTYAAQQQGRLSRLPAIRPDPLVIKIAKIRQQMVALHLQIKQTCRQQQMLNAAVAGVSVAQTAPPPTPDSSLDLPHDLMRDFSMIMRDDPAAAANWKQSFPETIPPSLASGLDLSHSVGQSFDAWSGWPSSLLSAPSAGPPDGRGNAPGAMGQMDGASAAEASARDISRSSAAVALDIEEFIPGKPWQGPTIRSADDDPFITPGGVSVSGEDSKQANDPSNLETLSAQRSSSNNGWPTSVSPELVDHNSMATARAPPGLGPSTPWLQQPAYTRSTSWTPRSNYGPRPGCSVALKNLPPQIDEVVVRGLCQQHGSVQHLHFHPLARQAVVTYSSVDEAAHAQRSLDAYLLAGASLSAELIPDADAPQLSSSVPTSLTASLSSIWSGMPGSSDGDQDSVWQTAGVWGASTSGL